jgi:hypothetical protein
MLSDRAAEVDCPPPAEIVCGQHKQSPWILQTFVVSCEISWQQPQFHLYAASIVGRRSRTEIRQPHLTSGSRSLDVDVDVKPTTSRRLFLTDNKFLCLAIAISRHPSSIFRFLCIASAKQYVIFIVTSPAARLMN